MQMLGGKDNRNSEPSKSDDNFNQEPERVNKTDVNPGPSDEPTLELPEDDIPF
jgi:hypothetical protein